MPRGATGTTRCAHSVRRTVRIGNGPLRRVCAKQDANLPVRVGAAAKRWRWCPGAVGGPGRRASTAGTPRGTGTGDQKPEGRPASSSSLAAWGPRGHVVPTRWRCGCFPHVACSTPAAGRRCPRRSTILEMGRGDGAGTHDVVVASRMRRLAGAALGVADPAPLLPLHRLSGMPNTIRTWCTALASDPDPGRETTLAAGCLGRAVRDAPVLAAVDVRRRIRRPDGAPREHPSRAAGARADPSPSGRRVQAVVSGRRRAIGASRRP